MYVCMYVYVGITLALPLALPLTQPWPRSQHCPEEQLAPSSHWTIGAPSVPEEALPSPRGSWCRTLRALVHPARNHHAAAAVAITGMLTALCKYWMVSLAGPGLGCWGARHPLCWPGTPWGPVLGSRLAPPVPAESRLAHAASSAAHRGCKAARLQGCKAARPHLPLGTVLADGEHEQGGGLRQRLPHGIGNSVTNSEFTGNSQGGHCGAVWGIRGHAP